MPTKIPVNGFGRLGKMLAMAQTWPYLMESQRRMMTQSMKEQNRRDIEEIDRLHGLDREAQKTYVLIVLNLALRAPPPNHNASKGSVHPAGFPVPLSVRCLTLAKT